VIRINGGSKWFAESVIDPSDGERYLANVGIPEKDGFQGDLSGVRHLKGRKATTTEMQTQISEQFPSLTLVGTVF
jgi:hypothetical protein